MLQTLKQHFNGLPGYIYIYIYIYNYIYTWFVPYYLGTSLPAALLRCRSYCDELNLCFMELQGQNELIIDIYIYIYIYIYRYIHVHLTKRLYIATWLSAAWLGSGSDFEQICLKIHFMELQVRMGWLLHTHKYTYIYIYTYHIYEIWPSLCSYGYPQLCFRAVDYSIHSSMLSNCMLKMSCPLSLYMYICISHKTYLRQ